MNDIVNIAEVEKQYQDEWVLFEVLETDEWDLPIKSRLLCHSKSRQEIHKVAMEKRCRDNLIVYTGDPVPPGVAVALH